MGQAEPEGAAAGARPCSACSETTDEGFTLARLVAPLALLGALASHADAQAPRRDSLTLYEFPDYRGASVTFYGDNANVGSTGFATKAQSAQVVGSWRLCAGGGYRNRCEVVSGNIRDLSAYGLSRQVGSAQRLGAQAYAAAPAVPGPRYETPSPAPYAAPAPRTQPQPTYAPPRTPAAPTYAPPQRDQGYAPGPYGGYDLAPPLDAPSYGPSYAPPPEPGYSDARPGYGSAAPYDYRDYAGPAVDAAPYSAPAAPYAPSGGGTVGTTATFFASPNVRGLDVSAERPDAADAFCRSQAMGFALYFDQTQRAARAIDMDGRTSGPGPVLRDVLCRRY